MTWIKLEQNAGYSPLYVVGNAYKGKFYMVQSIIHAWQSEERPDLFKYSVALKVSKHHREKECRENISNFIENDAKHADSHMKFEYLDHAQQHADQKAWELVTNLKKKLDVGKGKLVYWYKTNNDLYHYFNRKYESIMKYQNG